MPPPGFGAVSPSPLQAGVDVSNPLPYPVVYCKGAARRLYTAGGPTGLRSNPSQAFVPIYSIDEMSLSGNTNTIESFGQAGRQSSESYPVVDTLMARLSSEPVAARSSSLPLPLTVLYIVSPWSRLSRKKLQRHGLDHFHRHFCTDCPVSTCPSPPLTADTSL